MTEQAVARLDAINASDPERAHMEADAVLESLVSPEVLAAYLSVGARCRWWAFS